MTVTTGLWARIIAGLVIGHAFCSAAMAFDLAGDTVFPASDPKRLWVLLPVGYICTILIETPVLLIGLSRQITFRQRLFAGAWLSACTYPIVMLVLPVVFAESTRGLYLLVAETFAPVAECALFWAAFQRRLDLSRGTQLRNFAVIVLANLMSFGAGEILATNRWFSLI